MEESTVGLQEGNPASLVFVECGIDVPVTVNFHSPNYHNGGEPQIVFGLIDDPALLANGKLYVPSRESIHTPTTILADIRAQLHIDDVIITDNAVVAKEKWVESDRMVMFQIQGVSKYVVRIGGQQYWVLATNELLTKSN